MSYVNSMSKKPLTEGDAVFLYLKVLCHIFERLCASEAIYQVGTLSSSLILTEKL